MLPKDPYILLSYLNTQLRDHYPSLEEFCAATDQSLEEIEATLQKVGCVYDPQGNRFIREKT